jgi:hypothetical protein
MGGYGWAMVMLLPALAAWPGMAMPGAAAYRDRIDPEEAG